MTPRGPKPIPLLDRLGPKLLVGDGCWEWLGATTQDGYSQVDDRGVTRRVHRVMYELLIGPIPEGLQLDHLCRNRRCVRPAHLEPVTCKENVRRSMPFRSYDWMERRTHCKKGHALRSSTRPDGRYRSRCPTCAAEANQRWYQAKKRRATAPDADASDVEAPVISQERP